MDFPTRTTVAVATDRSIQRLGLFVFLYSLVSVSAQALSVILPPDIDYTDLHKAAHECDMEKARLALDVLLSETNDNEMNKPDREGYTPLAYAASSGCSEVVRLLVEQGAAVDAMDNQTRWTPLLRAASQRHADVVRYLLAHGANVDAKAAFGQTPLTAAILGSVFRDGPEGNHDETVQVLLSAGADIDLPGQFDWSPLMTAVLRGDAGLVKLLVGKGANLPARDKAGRTALDFAEERDEREIGDILKNSRAAHSE